mgnify:FL=1|jgi:hypothetical protein
MKNNPKHSELVKDLQSQAPKIFDLAWTMDMGYEFSAILQEGVIFAEPGMLLDYSEGQIPFDEWFKEPNEVFKEKFTDFIKEFQNLTPYEEIPVDDLMSIFNQIEKSES